jgi:hypothetical protein
MPFRQNAVVAVASLDFQAKIPCSSSQGAESFLHRVFGQGGSNSVLFVFICLYF